MIFLLKITVLKMFMLKHRSLMRTSLLQCTIVFLCYSVNLVGFILFLNTYLLLLMVLLCSAYSNIFYCKLHTEARGSWHLLAKLTQEIHSDLKGPSHFFLCNQLAVRSYCTCGNLCTSWQKYAAPMNLNTRKLIKILWTIVHIHHKHTSLHTITDCYM